MAFAGTVDEGAFDEQRFAAFYAEQRSRALRQARRLVEDPDVAEDVVAEAFARVLRRWRAQPIAEPVHYLARTVRNAGMDHFRRLARERDTLSRAARSFDARGDFVAEAVEARAVVEGLLGGLAPRQRRAVSLRYLRDLSEGDTAASLGISRGTVKSSTSRGLAHLRERFAAEAAA